MTQTDQLRLARIRADAEKWIALNPEAKNWDSAFLISLIDELRGAK